MKKFKSEDLLAALLGLGMAFELRWIGRLLISEIAIVVLFPFYFCRYGRLLRDKRAAALLALGALWLWGQMMTDIIRQTASGDYTRGWARITFFLAEFSFLIMLTRGNVRRLLLLHACMAAYYLGSGFSDPLATQWKFIWAPVCQTMLVVYLCLVFRKAPWHAIGFLVALAFINFHFNSRSAGGTALLSAAAVAFYLRAGWWRRRFCPAAMIYRLGSLAVFLAVAAAGILWLYQEGASQGYFGEEARRKFHCQSKEKGLMKLVMSGRGEIHASSRAIADSPLLGHGSWAKNAKYVKYMLRAADINLLDGRYYYELRHWDGLIPAHSYLLGAWVEAGVLGALFWSGAGVLLAASLLRVLHRPPDMAAALVLTTCAGLAWPILFSPFGMAARLINAKALCILLLPWTQSKQETRHAADA